MKDVRQKKLGAKILSGKRTNFGVAAGLIGIGAMMQNIG